MQRFIVITDEIYCEQYLIMVKGRDDLMQKVRDIEVWVKISDPSFADILNKLDDEFGAYAIIPSTHISATHHGEE